MSLDLGVATIEQTITKIRVRIRIQEFYCKRHVELSNWCCNSSSEQNDKLLQKNSQIYCVDFSSNSIVASRTEYACGNSMHLFIEFLFESPAGGMVENLCFGKIEGVAGIHAV